MTGQKKEGGASPVFPFLLTNNFYAVLNGSVFDAADVNIPIKIIKSYIPVIILRR
jgi:hypothetical protein